MTIDEIITELNALSVKLRAKYANLDDTTFILARSAKMSEEYGEFVDELLSSLRLQRQDKLAAFKSTDLSSEFGDAFITLMLLGISARVDVKAAITKRLKEQSDKWSSHEE